MAIAENCPSAAGSAGSGADKKCRWRKGKQQVTDNRGDSLATTISFPKPGFDTDNQAASFAFRGLHGARTNFSMITGSTDEVYRSLLGDNAFYFQELLCRSDDFSMFNALSTELNYRQCWMSGGTPLWRPTAHGNAESLAKSPTYEHIVRWLAGHFGVEPIRSIANFYRNGDDYTSFHSDQYFDGVDMTVGASFGEERNLVFQHKDTKEEFCFPQRNGDIFAFTDAVNYQFVHSVPRERRRALSASRCCSSGRVSIIVWAKRDQPEWKKLAATKPLALIDSPHVLDYDPNARGVAETEVTNELEGTRISASLSNLENAGAATTAAASAIAIGPVTDTANATAPASVVPPAAVAPARRWAGRGRQL